MHRCFQYSRGIGETFFAFLLIIENCKFVLNLKHQKRASLMWVTFKKIKIVKPFALSLSGIVKNYICCSISKQCIISNLRKSRLKMIPMVWKWIPKKMKNLSNSLFHSMTRMIESCAWLSQNIASWGTTKVAKIVWVLSFGSFENNWHFIYTYFHRILWGRLKLDFQLCFQPNLIVCLCTVHVKNYLSITKSI